MSLGAARAAIRSFVESRFTAAPLVWPNERTFAPDVPAAFVAVEVIGLDNAIRGVGDPSNRLFIHSGLIMAHCFAVFGTGSGAADTMADALADLLTRQDILISGAAESPLVRTEDPTTHDGELGSEDGNYWRVTVSVPFDFYYWG
jgi:hypothetical protein